jgi:Ca-activated chloride channel family protein
MRFANPHALWLLFAVPAAVLGYGLAFAARRRRLARLGDDALVAKMAATVSVPRKLLRAALVVLALALVALALGRPQAGGRAIRRIGIDLVVALDFSRSMLAMTSTRPGSRALWFRLAPRRPHGDRGGGGRLPRGDASYPAHHRLRGGQPSGAISACGHAGRRHAIGGRSAPPRPAVSRANGGATGARAILLLTDGEDTTASRSRRRTGLRWGSRFTPSASAPAGRADSGGDER